MLLFVLCSLLAASLGGLGGLAGRARRLGRERDALAKQIAALVREVGDAETRAERLRTFALEAERLKVECRQVAIRRATASQEFTGYARDLALRRERAANDFRAQCEADGRALEAHRARLSQQRLAAERELEAHLASLARRREAAERGAAPAPPAPRRRAARRELEAHVRALRRLRATTEAALTEHQRALDAQVAGIEFELKGRHAELRQAIQGLEELARDHERSGQAPAEGALVSGAGPAGGRSAAAPALAAESGAYPVSKPFVKAS